MRRLLLLLLPALLLSACGGESERAPFLDSRVPPSLSPRFFPPEGWAWGLVQAGEAPPQRYGVSSPAVVPSAQVLILTGYGESAEAWFETARQLNARGYTVWVIERAGQGGSGRSASPRDLGHVKDFSADVAVVRALANSFIPQDGHAPLVVVAHGVGGVVALQAVRAGMRADGLVLTSPDFAPPPQTPVPPWSKVMGAATLRMPGAGGWSREGPDGVGLKLTHDRSRGRVQLAWQTANPDLRMGGPSVGWLTAADEANSAAQKGLTGVKTPTLLLTPGEVPQADTWARTRVCQALPACVETRFAKARPAFHLERDVVRDPWLAAIDSFIRERAAALKPAPAGAKS